MWVIERILAKVEHIVRHDTLSRSSNPSKFVVADNVNKKLLDTRGSRFMTMIEPSFLLSRLCSSLNSYNSKY